MVRLTDDNRLSSTHPLVADEWHPTKNGDLTPQSVSFGSARKVWWQCKRQPGDPEHAWEAVIQSRTRRKNPAGCPACGHHKVTQETSLAAMFPEQARLFCSRKNRKSATEVRAHSNKMFHWQCPLGHVWTRSANRMVRPGAGCPFCKGKRVSATNSLANVYPAIAKFWSPRNESTPDSVTAGSAQHVWWRCPRGHEYQMAVKRKTGPTPRGCPRCNDKRSLPEYSLYAELRLFFPTVQNRHRLYGHEVDIWVPEFRLAIEYDGHAFHRSREAFDKKKVNLFAQHGVTLYRVREPGLARVSKTDIMLGREEVGQAAAVIKVLKAISRSLMDGTLRNKIAAYVRRGKLSNQIEALQLINGGGVHEESLAARLPQLAQEWDFQLNHPLTPDAFRPGSHRKVWWRCLSHPSFPYEAIIKNRVSGNGCPRCASKIITPDRSLAAQRPDVMNFFDKQANVDLEPTALSVKSERIAQWKCRRGHTWSTTIVAMTRIRTIECPICTSLAVLHPHLLAEFARDLNPLIDPFQLKPKSGKKIWWRCDIDSQHVWLSSPDSRVRVGSGCPECYKEARKTQSLSKLGKAIPGVKSRRKS